MIFVSVAEHYAVILADAAIDVQVPKGSWQAIIDDLTEAFSENRAADGFVAAIEASVAHLAAHFPPSKRP